ncbi:MAG: hypothetical protein Fur005_35400 [Roseiflexaceae bacterium]
MQVQQLALLVRWWGLVQQLALLVRRWGLVQQLALLVRWWGLVRQLVQQEQHYHMHSGMRSTALLLQTSG